MFFFPKGRSSRCSSRVALMAFRLSARHFLFTVRLQLCCPICEWDLPHTYRKETTPKSKRINIRAAAVDFKLENDTFLCAHFQSF